MASLIASGGCDKVGSATSAYPPSLSQSSPLWPVTACDLSHGVTLSRSNQDGGLAMGASTLDWVRWLLCDDAVVDVEEALSKAQDFTPDQRFAAEQYGRIFARARRWCDPAVRDQASAILGRMHERLTPQERAVVEMVACRGRTFRLLAELTGRKVADLKELYRRGTDKLFPFFERRAV